MNDSSNIELPSELKPMLPKGQRSQVTPSGHLVVHDTAVEPARVVEILQPYLTKDRMDRILAVVQSRTRTVIPVVEGAANTGNVGAVLRTAEGLGFDEFHVIATDQTYKRSGRSSRGAGKWLDTRTWRDAQSCLEHLHDRGYQILAATVSPDAMPLEEVDFMLKTAVVFGNEAEGVSKNVLSRADGSVRADLTGFVESYNISVAAAIVLYHAFRHRVRLRGSNGDLGPKERLQLAAEYSLRAVQNGGRIVMEELRRAASHHDR